MAEICTARLRLLALSLAQLILCRDNQALFRSTLGVPFADDAISEASLRAISVKIDKMQHEPVEQHDWYTYWLILMQPENTALGVVGFKGAPNASGDAELGYGISPLYRNQGYMTEAVQGLVQWAFQHAVCRGIIAETLRSNPASQKVLEKNSFKIVRETASALIWRLPCQRSNPP